MRLLLWRQFWCCEFIWLGLLFSIFPFSFFCAFCSLQFWRTDTDQRDIGCKSHATVMKWYNFCKVLTWYNRQAEQLNVLILQKDDDGVGRYDVCKLQWSLGMVKETQMGCNTKLWLDVINLRQLRLSNNSLMRNGEREAKEKGDVEGRRE